MIEMVQDNYDRYEAYEREIERYKRIHRKLMFEEEEFDTYELPFYEEFNK